MAAQIKTCGWCGKKFDASGKTLKGYCSYSCQEKKINSKKKK